MSEWKGPIAACAFVATLFSVGIAILMSAVIGRTWDEATVPSPDNIVSVTEQYPQELTLPSGGTVRVLVSDFEWDVYDRPTKLVNTRNGLWVHAYPERRFDNVG